MENIICGLSDYDRSEYHNALDVLINLNMKQSRFFYSHDIQRPLIISGFRQTGTTQYMINHKRDCDIVICSNSSMLDVYKSRGIKNNIFTVAKFNKSTKNDILNDGDEEVKVYIDCYTGNLTNFSKKVYKKLKEILPENTKIFIIMLDLPYV